MTLSGQDLIISGGCSQQPASPLGTSGPLINKEESLEEEAVITKLAFWHDIQLEREGQQLPAAAEAQNKAVLVVQSCSNW